MGSDDRDAVQTMGDHLGIESSNAWCCLVHSAAILVSPKVWDTLGRGFLGCSALRMLKLGSVTCI